MTKDTSKKDYAVCDQCRAKKIRCGREKPSCANCIRLGQECKWSGQGKKCNQTALLSHTILGLGSRLQHLETSVLDTQNSLKRLLDSSPSYSSSNSIRPSTSRSASVLESSASSSPRPSTTLSYTRPSGQFLTQINPRLGERYYGPTSLESLMISMRSLISDIWESNNQSLRETASVAQQKIDLLIGHGREEQGTKDGSLPTAPPFAILDAMIDPYFTTNNPHLPIWRKESFVRMATALRQSNTPEQDLASIVCCNNLVLMALSANSLSARRERPTQQNIRPRRTSSIDSDVITGFLANSKRALENIDQIVSPNLINIQALLSLCVVAQEHLSTSLAETLLVLAARCAKSVGIHQWQCLHGQLSDDDVCERRNVSYCLYALDKSISWTAGSSPSILTSDVFVDTGLMSSDDSSTAFLTAKASLAQVEDSIYSEVYAGHIKPRSEEEVGCLISNVSERLKHWLVVSKSDLNEAENNPEYPPIKIELSLGYLCSQLLLYWPFKNHPKVGTILCLRIARKIIGLMLRLWRSQCAQAQHAIFPLIVASYPPLYLWEVYYSVLDSEGQNSVADSELLREFTDMLGVVTDSRDDGSYCRKLYELSVIVIDLTSTIQPQHKRRKIADLNVEMHGSAHSLLHDQIPDMFSPSNSNSSNSNNTSENLESDELYFDRSIIPDSQDAFSHLHAIATRDSGMAISPMDELGPDIGSYADGFFDNLDTLAYDLASIRDGFGEGQI